FTLHAARLLERMQGRAEAALELDEALEQARHLPATEPYMVMRLRLIVARLGLARRGPPLSEDDRKALVKPLVTEGVGLFAELPIRSIDQVPGLLRDLAAELGEGDPQILQAAFSSVGFQGDPEEIAGAMADWDRIVSTDRGATAGVLADTA